MMIIYQKKKMSRAFPDKEEGKGCPRKQENSHNGHHSLKKKGRESKLVASGMQSKELCLGKGGLGAKYDISLIII